MLIYKVDYYFDNTLIPIVEYKIYNIKTKQLLNLSICNDTKIKILYPTNNINEDNLFLYNTSSKSYIDIYYKYI